MIDIRELSDYILFVHVKDEFLESIKNRIYSKFGSIRRFALFDKSFSSECFYYSILSGKKDTRLCSWLKWCRTFDIPLEYFKNNILKIRSRYTGNLLLNKLPIEPSAELASLVGHALGDGHVSENLWYFSYTNNSFELHNEVKSLISNFCTFGYNERFHKALTIQYPSIVAVILHLAGAQNGNKIIKDFLVPKWILDGSKSIKISFLRALFDDEGTVKKSSHEILLKLSKNEFYLNSLLDFMNQVKKLLEEIGIEVTSIRKENIIEGKNGRTIQLVLSIHGYKNFIKFLYDIDFHHKEKQQDLQTLVNSYKKFPLRKGRGQKLVYNKLVKPKTIYTLSEELNISIVSVYKHLKKLQAKNVVEKIEYSRTKPAFWRRLNG